LPALAQQAAPADAPASAPAAAPAEPAQDSSAPAQAPAAATPAAAPTWSIGPIDFSGTIDGYYSYNSNHPTFGGGAGNVGQTNLLYNFNGPANQFSLNLVKIGMSHTADPVGFEFDIAYGKTMDYINATASPTGFDRFVENAYVTFKPAKAHGFEVDFGKFVTSAGAEVIESYSNWNYSRSLLFSWAIPYYHFGLRTSWPVGNKWTAGVQLVNGWNNTVDNNTGKTFGATALGTYAKWSLAVNYYGGPENTGTNRGWKHLFDTTITITPSSKAAFYINYDYGHDRFPTTTNGSALSLATWQGIAGALHITPNSHWSVTPRIEWFDDPNGFALLGAGANSYTGVVLPIKQQVKEFTGTLEYKFLEGLMWRGEYRYDWSNQPFFLRGPATSVKAAPVLAGLGNISHQQTVTFAIIGYFGPKR